MLYGFQLWFYNNTSLSYPLKKLNKMQRVTIWILRVFCTLPAFGIKAITRLILIHLHFQKLSGKLQLRAYSLSYNHILRLLFESRLTVSNIPHWLSLNTLTNNQHLKIKGSIVDMDNRFNEVFPLFDPFNKEFFSGSCLINIFSNHFSFYLLPKQGDTNLKPHIHSLNDITIKSSLDLTIALVVSDASVRNQIATSISYIHIHNKPIIKMLHIMERFDTNIFLSFLSIFLDFIFLFF